MASITQTSRNFNYNSRHVVTDLLLAEHAALANKLSTIERVVQVNLRHMDPILGNVTSSILFHLQNWNGNFVIRGATYCQIRSDAPIEIPEAQKAIKTSGGWTLERLRPYNFVIEEKLVQRDFPTKYDTSYQVVQQIIPVISWLLTPSLDSHCHATSVTVMTRRDAQIERIYWKQFYTEKSMIRCKLTGVSSNELTLAQRVELEEECNHMIFAAAGLKLPCGMSKSISKNPFSLYNFRIETKTEGPAVYPPAGTPKISPRGVIFYPPVAAPKNENEEAKEP